MEEHKLGRNFHVIFIVVYLLGLIYFHREVPESQLVIGGSDGKNRFFTRLEGERCDSLGVPPDTSDGFHFTLALAASSLVEVPEIPDAELTLIISRSQQELGRSVPTDDINITVRGLERHLGFHLGGSEIPQLDGLVAGARG